MNTSPKINRTLANRILPPIGLGCMGMSEFYGPADEDASLAALRFAFDRGYRHFDTADMYGRGHNEELLGRFLRQLTPSERAEAFVATKAGILRSPLGGSDIQISNSPAYLRGACESSLRRLNVESIDLFYLHRKEAHAEIEDTMNTLAKLQSEGKVRAVGLSEVSSETLERAHRVHPVAAVQSELSLWTREAEASMLPTCEKLGIAFVAFSPLGRGLASGKLQPGQVHLAENGDIRSTLPRFQGKNLEANLELVKEFTAEAELQECTPAQLALAWVLSRGAHVHAIPGSRRERYIFENFAALQLELTEQTKQTIDSIFQPGRVQGSRYSENLMQTVSK